MSNRFTEKLSGFAELAAADVQAIERATARVRQFRAKHDLIREGDEPGPVFVMLDGWGIRYKILPSGTRQIMAFLMPGDACDLNIGLLAEMDHSIQTLTSALVATISRTEMRALMDDHPAIARAMHIAQLVDQGTLRAWIVSMGRRNSIERVAHLLCEVFIRAQRTGIVTNAGLLLPISQIVLSDALGDDTRPYQPCSKGSTTGECDRPEARHGDDQGSGPARQDRGLRRKLPAPPDAYQRLILPFRRDQNAHRRSRYCRADHDG